MMAESHLDRSVAFRVAGRQYRLSGRAVHDFLDGETATLFAYVFQKNLPEWTYERTR